ncbi:MAG TPA: alanine racemase [Caulobacteraceae bacterium]|nr:alanine racemase [Caulobacteraceae bacterium]
MPAARARLTIDLDALAANYRWFVDQAAAAEVAPVVKADGYGLGAAPVARRLWAEGARSFHVARLEEGEALRAALGSARPAKIYVLDGAPSGSAGRLIEADLIPVLSSSSQIETYAARARADAPLPCALHVDTGMNRLGLRLEELDALVEAPDRLDRLKVELVISHLACAERPEERMNAEQAGRLTKARRLLPGVRASLANSAGVLLGPDFHFDMVRPGIGLYGGGPLGKPHAHLQPVATLEAPILDVRAVPEGETVGYGMEFTAEAPLRIAVVAVGYADGVMRAGWPKGAVWFAGQRRRLAGRVSMDLITVDVTDCEAAQPGAMVELFGPNLMLDDAADAAGTNAYEILTRLGDRAERAYIGQVE